MNAAAISPRVVTCRTPPAPRRVKMAFFSSQSRVWATDSSWASRIRVASFGSASAQSADTLFTGEKVRSNPETAFGGADTFAMNP